MRLLVSLLVFLVVAVVVRFGLMLAVIRLGDPRGQFYASTGYQVVALVVSVGLAYWAARSTHKRLSRA